MIDKLLGAILGFGAASILSKKDGNSFAKGGEIGVLLAPNGKPSNLTPEQYKLVRTPAFKKWFGDWENDPENASKVVDENGEPLVVYHGTNVEFYQFDLKYFGKTDKGWYGRGFYFTPNKNFAFAKDAVEQFGGKEVKLELFLNIKNPLYGEAYIERHSNLVGSAKDRDKDGVIILYDYGHELERQVAEIIVWESKQIKLANGTNTTFDGSNSDIRFGNGGEVEDLISKGVVELKMFDTKPEHAKEYGLDSKKPLYVQTICVSENERLKGIGNKVLQYIDDYASKNGHDVVFGHITQKAQFSKDNRQTYFCDIDLIKHWLHLKGYVINPDNNDFHKLIQNNSDVRFDKGGLIAPNGKPSNLTPEQYKLVRTKAFKDWFGDWENDPANASKVVDENGEPLVLHRGNLVNQQDLGYTFDLGKNFLKKQGNNDFGFFFTEDIEVAKKYMLVNFYDEIKGGSITSIFLRSKKQLNLLDFGLKKSQDGFIKGLTDKGVVFTDEFQYLEKRILGFDESTYKGWGYNIFDYFDVFPDLRNVFIINGFDSVLFYEVSRAYSEYKVYVALKPNQIKLADGTNTAFDANSPDIRYDYGGIASTLLE